jgi:hypothetical protein
MPITIYMMTSDTSAAHAAGSFNSGEKSKSMVMAAPSALAA